MVQISLSTMDEKLENSLLIFSAFDLNEFINSALKFSLHTVEGK